ncbi:MAG: CAP domain-containing protein [Myxococcales bacterium]|nr:CAP domain-containing protein [Myxococcales bacterium]
MLVATNAARAAGATCGPYEGEPARQYPPAPALTMNHTLRLAARLHSQDMATRGYFDHVTPDGRDPFDRMHDIGFMGAQPWGENLAAGSPTAQAAVDGLMNSPGHCRNIMNAEYRVVGLGYAYGEANMYGHLWTQKFAAGD